MIPKRLFQVWLSDVEMDRRDLACLSTWDKLGFEIVPIRMANAEYLGVPLETPADRAIAADLIRLDLLLKHGGIALDNDIEILKSFDHLLGYSFFCGAESRSWANVAVMGAEPGCGLIQEVVRKLPEHRQHGNTFCLKALSTVLARYGWPGNENETWSDGPGGILVEKREVFYPYLWDQVRPKTFSEKTLAVHQWRGSWRPRVSVVIPCYGQAHYLSESIESALGQTYGNLEVVVVNDGSPDNTSEVARRYPVVLVEQENRGLAAARNAGVAASSGEYALTLDADDLLSPDCIEECVKAMRYGDVVCPGQQEFGASENFWIRSEYRVDLQDFMTSNRIHCASLFRRRHWEQVGGQDETMLLGFEDWDFWIRVVRDCKARVRVINKPLFYYRVRLDSMSHSVTPKHCDGILEYMATKHPGFLQATMVEV